MKPSNFLSFDTKIPRFFVFGRKFVQSSVYKRFLVLKMVTPVLSLIIYVTQICDRSSTVPLVNGLFIV